MPWDGEGKFNRIYQWEDEAQQGNKISSMKMDIDSNDIAIGLSNCLTIDGQTTVTNNLNLNNKKIINMSPAVNETDAINLKQLVNRDVVDLYEDTSRENNYIIIRMSAISLANIKEGIKFSVKVAHTIVLKDIDDGRNGRIFLNDEADNQFGILNIWQADGERKLESNILISDSTYEFTITKWTSNTKIGYVMFYGGHVQNIPSIYLQLHPEDLVVDTYVIKLPAGIIPKIGLKFTVYFFNINNINNTLFFKFSDFDGKYVIEDKLNNLLHGYNIPSTFTADFIITVLPDTLLSGHIMMLSEYQATMPSYCSVTGVNTYDSENKRYVIDINDNIYVYFRFVCLFDEAAANKADPVVIYLNNKKNNTIYGPYGIIDRLGKVFFNYDIVKNLYLDFILLKQPDTENNVAGLLLVTNDDTDDEPPTHTSLYKDISITQNIYAIDHSADNIDLGETFFIDCNSTNTAYPELEFIDPIKKVELEEKYSIVGLDKKPLPVGSIIADHTNEFAIIDKEKKLVQLLTYRKPENTVYKDSSTIENEVKISLVTPINISEADHFIVECANTNTGPVKFIFNNATTKKVAATTETFDVISRTLQPLSAGDITAKEIKEFIVMENNASKKTIMVTTTKAPDAPIVPADYIVKTMEFDYEEGDHIVAHYYNSKRLQLIYTSMWKPFKSEELIMDNMVYYAESPLSMGGNSLMNNIAANAYFFETPYVLSDDMQSVVVTLWTISRNSGLMTFFIDKLIRKDNPEYKIGMTLEGWGFEPPTEQQLKAMKGRKLKSGRGKPPHLTQEEELQFKTVERIFNKEKR